jgi:branched-chain amino acid transport system ATP-binding protein
MILDVQSCHAHYGKSHVLQGVSLQVAQGEVVTLLGRNGAGKTTTLKCIVGVVPPTQGSISFCGQAIHKSAAHAIASQGVCLVPEHRGIF